MKLSTKYFGEIEGDEREIISFPQGIPGFEGNCGYLLIPFDEEEEGLLCLQSVEDPELAFIVINPFYVDSGYEPRLTDDDLKTLHCGADTPLAFYVIAVLREPFSDTTINLKCPLAINPAPRLGVQAVMDDNRYSMRSPLVPSPQAAPEKED